MSVRRMMINVSIMFDTIEESPYAIRIVIFFKTTVNITCLGRTGKH
jgi:hypothetical protein